MRSALSPWALLAGLAVACDDASFPRAAPVLAREPDGNPDRASEPAVDVPAGLENLAAIGYAQYGEEDPADSAPKERGLVVHDAERSAPGYTLITAMPSSQALLLDAEGREVRSWSDPESIEWKRAVLGPTGDLLVVGGRYPEVEPDEKGGVPSEAVATGVPHRLGRFLARYRFDGELVWQHFLPIHHDVEWLPDGTILALGDAPRSEGDFRFMDTTLLVLSGAGEVQRQVSLFEVLSARPELFRLDLSAPHNALLPDGTVDLFHANSLKHMPFPELAAQGELYQERNVLVSIRHQNLIAILDLEQPRLLWCWGPGEVLCQHEATWLPSGKVLLFDNGNDRGYSRIVEVDPRTNDVTWTWTAPVPTDFFSNGRGTSQELSNGNVLVADSNSAAVFEVTREGDVVWRYVLRDEKGRLVPLRAFRYEPAFVEELLARE